MKCFYYKIIYCFIIFSLVILGQSCEKYSDTFVPVTARTVLVCMLANNNLECYARRNINDMMPAVSEGKLNGGNLAIYLNSSEAPPQLIQLVWDEKGCALTKILNTFAKSAAWESLSSVISDMKKLFSSGQYGPILWGHATSWLPNVSQLVMAPPAKQMSNGLISRAVGLKSSKETENDYMEITDIALDIPDKTFSFIISDTCMTGQIETAYQLRNKTGYTIGSAAEVIAYGLPYRKVIPLLFGTNAGLAGVCDANYNYYMNMDIPEARAVTTAFIRIAHLEKMAAISRKILSARSGKIPFLETGNMQHLDKAAPYIFYDLQEFFENLAAPGEMEEFNACLGNIVIKQRYSRASNFYPMTINRHCGLNVYIPGSGDNSLENFYTALDWHNDAYPAEYRITY